MSLEHPVAVLMETDSILPSERDIRLEDYLNDKFQTIADFAELDELISNVDRQASQLQEQLQDAQNKLAEAKKASQNHTASILKQTADFEAQQSSVNQRLTAMGSSTRVDDAVRKLEEPMEKLRRLHLAEKYVDLVLDVDKLAKEARGHLPGDINAALKPYLRLKGYAENLFRLQPAADDAAGHLVDYVQSRHVLLYKEMKEILVGHFKQVLGRQDWTAKDYKHGAEFRDLFKKLLDLQAPELACEEVRILLPMTVLAADQIARFRYHFMREDARTAMDSKPKQFLEWIVKHFEEYRPALESKVGPILREHFRDCNLPLLSIYIDPVGAWITAFLPIVEDKVESYLFKHKDDSGAFHEMITTLMAFDRSLTRSFRYTGGDIKKKWEGLTGVILETWFDTWLSHEKEFALSRYEVITDDRKNASLDYESHSQGRTKPTVGAVSIVYLLDNVTKAYKRAPKTKYKYRFVTDVQIEILLKYDAVLRGSLEAYKTNTTTVGRTLNAVSREQQQRLEGLGGIESLCKIFGSAEYIANTLKDWMLDPFFIELYAELRSRANKNNEKYGNNGAGTPGYNYVKKRSSFSSDDVSKHETLFDQTLETFKVHKEEAEKLIKEAIAHTMPRVFRPYFTRPQWTTIDESNTGQVPLSSLPNVTAELVEPLTWLNSYMSFLHKALSTAAFRRIWSASLQFLQDLLWNDVLMRSNFTNLGAAQFHRDLTAIWDIIESYIPNASLSNPGMPRLRDAIRLLNLPFKAQDENEKGWSLQDVNERLFTGNEEAKEVVREMGLEMLSHKDARNIVQRRVECVP